MHMAVLRDVYGGNSKNEIIERILDYVWTQLQIHGEIEPPIIGNIQKSRFVKSRRVKINYVDMDKTDGYLDIYPEEFSLFVNINLSERRQRSVIAHELGHTFLFNINKFPIKSYLKVNWLMKDRWKSEDGLAWQIGRQILVPELLLKEYCQSGHSIKLFEELKDIFNVTTDIMARRLIHDLKLWDIFMFVSEFKESEQIFTIPKNKERFKSEKSFQYFKLNMHWSIIQQALLKIYRTGMDWAYFKIGKKRYKIEVSSPFGTSWKIVIISPLTYE